MIYNKEKYTRDIEISLILTLIFIILLLLTVYGFFQPLYIRYRLIRNAQPENRFNNPLKRIRYAFFSFFLLVCSVKRERITTGMVHIFILYGSLIFGLITFFAIAMFIVENKKFEPIQSIDEFIKLLIPLAGFAVMFFSSRIYNKNISSVNYNDDLLSKISKYRTFKIIQWALLESVGFLSIVGFIITGNYLHAIIFLFMLGFLILIKPSKEQFFRDFKISDDQKIMFSNS